MNLDVNMRQVQQSNLTQTQVQGLPSVQEAIFAVNGKSFQNSPMHVVFYEKVKLAPKEDETDHPKITSLSYSKFNPTSSRQTFPEQFYDFELYLSSPNFTAQFVTQEQYQQLLYVLGQKTYASTTFEQGFHEIVTLFKNFHTGTMKNFMKMLYQLDIPYVYNQQKTL